MVSYSCQSTGIIYYDPPYVGWGGITLVAHDCGESPQEVMVDITTPWSAAHNNEIFPQGHTEIYSRAITGGTEYYSLECTDVWCGAETNHATFTECWWDGIGNRYVKTSGNDALMGVNWATAWKTAEHGFQNIPAGKDLYVEEGLYGGETLSNLNPPQTMKMYIQPSEHIEAACNVLINDRSSFTDGTISGTGSEINLFDKTILDIGKTISHNGKVVAFSFFGPNALSRSLKFKIFRDDGTNYNFIGESDVYTFDGLKWFRYNLCDIDVQAGDIIGVYITSGSPRVGYYGGLSRDLVYKNGDIVSNSAKATWATWESSCSWHIGAHGFY